MLHESDFSILKVRLNEFNEKFKPAVPFFVQAGDEIQGLIKIGDKPVLSLSWLMGMLYPMKVRWGIGKGGVDSSFQKSTADMRGEVFEYSRNALNYAKKKKQLFAYYSAEQTEKNVNVILRLISGYLDDWDKMAFRRFSLYDDSKTIYKVAELEGVSPEAINKHMNRKKLKLVLDSINFLDETIFRWSTP
jgi:hypothetical protein